MDDGATYDLLTRWRAGDPDALGRLLDRDLEWIRSFVHRRLGQTPARRFGDTDDYVQEAVVRLLRDGPRFVLADRDQFRALLSTIALNTIRSSHRAQHTQKRAVAREQPLGTDTVLLLDRPHAMPAPPDEQAALAEQEEWLRLGFLLLDGGDQQVIDLHWQGRTDAEIGAELGTSDNTARMRRQRATGRLTRLVLELKAGRLKEVLAERAG